MTYKSAAALEMAVKEAAKASPQDTGRAIAGFYFHRLLCRVFADSNKSFVLKGGRSVLARTLDGRATRDIDPLSTLDSIEGALADLRRLAQRDLGDFVVFEYAGAEPIKPDDEYRSGLSVRFIPMLGAKRMQAIAIDLVIDEVPLEGAEAVSPADRIDVKGLDTCDYLVYPVGAALADKFCALAERHNGRASSRVKDLVDIVVYTLTCDIDGTDLQARLRREMAVRKIGPIESFAIPQEWANPQARQFAKLCAQTGIPTRLHDIGEASKLAAKLLDPALEQRCGGLCWDHESLNWEE